MNQVSQCRYGDMVYPARDQYVGRSLALYGEYSEAEVALFARLVRPGDTVVEVGANLGAHTVPLARLVGARGRVVALEPQRMLFYCLCANAALNGLTQIDARHGGAGESAGTLTVPELDYAAENNFGGLELGKPDPRWVSYVVPLMRLDDLGIDKCRFLKIDVEGMESRVLAGAAETVRRCRPFLYVEDDRKRQSAALRQRLWDLGYELYLHLPPLFNAENFRGQAENVFGRIVSRNLLGCPIETPLPRECAEMGLQALRRPAPKTAGARRDPAEWLAQGWAYHQAGDRIRAAEAYQHVLEAEPHHAEGLYLLGVIRLEQGQDGTAIGHLERAVQRQPDHAPAWEVLGVARVRQGQLEAAAAALRESLRWRPESAGTHANLAKVLARQRDWLGAAEAFRRAVDLNSQDADAYVGLGNALARQSDWSKSAEAYRQALSLQPELRRARTGLDKVSRQMAASNTPTP